MKFCNFLFVALIFLFYNISPAFGFSKTDSLLNGLNRAIADKDMYVNKKNDRVKSLRNKLRENRSPGQSYNIFKELYQEYGSFRYDSAFFYALKLQETARQLNDPEKMVDSKLKLSFTLLSSGMFKEAFDSLQTVNPAVLPEVLKADYYELLSRAYYDLADYNLDDYYSGIYLRKGSQYADSAIALSKNDQVNFYYLRGRKSLKENLPSEAIKDFQRILDSLDPSSHKYAMIAASLAIAYKENGEIEKATDLMISAAIADIKSSVTEATALMILSEYLYRAGDVSRAYIYIRQALKDAEFYGAKQRRIQASAILPIIEGEQFARVESQRKTLFVYAVVVSLLSLLVVVFAFIIFKQLKQLGKAKKKVTEANLSLQETNLKLQETNQMLQVTNDKLLEANKIKEECIGYSFNMYTEYLETIEKLKRDINRKIVARKYDDISHVMESINLKKERENLYQSFDKTFLKLFPDFVIAFNSFFKEDDQFLTRDSQTLNIELRIFALIRMGIHDHEQIAKILEYSVRTIYNYKTRVKNRSILSNEEFEQKVMEIKAF